MVKYHYILWGLYLYVNSGDKAVFAFLAAAEGAAVKLPQHENETLCDTHHITVHHWRAAQLRHAPPLMWSNICSCTLARPRTLSAPR